MNVTETGKGFLLTFSDNTTIELLNGKDGKNGQDGADGQDGVTPQLGITQINGTYYWTITINGETTILTDGYGNNIPVSTATNAGHDGAAGADGITPLFQVDYYGYWMISYDNGRTYSYIYDVYGNKVNATGRGSNSSSLTYTDNGSYVTIYFPNGSYIMLDKYQEFSISFSKTKGLVFDNHNQCSVTYQIKGADSYTHVEVLAKGNIKASVTSYGNSSGSITLTATGDIDYRAKVFVYLCNETVTITNTLTFDGVDTRIDDVVPPEIRDDVDDWIEIYDGINPPCIEGAFYMDPYACVYCSDNGFAPGEVISSKEIRFYNQNMNDNTLDYEQYQGDSHLLGPGAFVSGDNNNFTCYFNLTGYSSGIYVKEAVVLSGSYTSTGIQNCKYALVMVEKGSDPSHKIMNVGEFRVFKDQDGISVPISWNHARPTVAPDYQNISFGIEILNKK